MTTLQAFTEEQLSRLLHRLADEVDKTAPAYALAIACAAILQVVALVRLRTRRREPRAFRVGVNLRLGGRSLDLPALLAALPGPAIAGLRQRERDRADGEKQDHVKCASNNLRLNGWILFFHRRIL